MEPHEAAGNSRTSSSWRSESISAWKNMRWIHTQWTEAAAPGGGRRGHGGLVGLWVLVRLTWAGFLVVVQLESFVAVAGERTRRADADLFTVVFPLNTQINGCKTQRPLIQCVHYLSLWDKYLIKSGFSLKPLSFNVHQPYDVPGFGTYSTFNLITIRFYSSGVILWSASRRTDVTGGVRNTYTDEDQTLLPVQVLPSSFRVCPGRQRQWYEPGELSQMCSQPCSDTTHKSTPAGAEHQQGHYHTSKLLIHLEHKWEELKGEHAWLFLGKLLRLF